MFTRAARATERQQLKQFIDEVAAEFLAAKSTATTDADREAARRASWTQAALVLLNSNEFLFVH